MSRFDVPSESMRLALAEYCTAMADLTLDGRWSVAAGILRGNVAGRRPLDDEALLRHAEALVEAGIARSRHHACLMTAQMTAPAHQIETTRDRLRRKLRRKINVSDD